MIKYYIKYTFFVHNLYQNRLLLIWIYANCTKIDLVMFYHIHRKGLTLHSSLPALKFWKWHMIGELNTRLIVTYNQRSYWLTVEWYKIMTTKNSTGIWSSGSNNVFLRSFVKSDTSYPAACDDVRLIMFHLIEEGWL